MTFTRNKPFFLFLLFAFLQTNEYSFGQKASFPVNKWVDKLSDKSASFISGINEVLVALRGRDSSEAITILNELETKGSSAGKYFNPRFNLLKAIWLGSIKGKLAEDEISQMLKKALIGAYETDNDQFISFISWQYGSLMYGYGELEPAAMYCLYSAEMNEKTGSIMESGQDMMLGDILYRTQDYEKSIYYTNRGIEKRQTDTSFNGKSFEMSGRNTIALCWQRMGNYDSAISWFDSALKIAREIKNDIWTSIIFGNIGQIYFLQKKYSIAKPLLDSDYRESKSYGEVASAGNSLQWVARINLVEGKKDIALMQVKEALLLARQDSNVDYLQNIYYATADVYRAFKNNDSVYKYSQLYNQLHQGVEKQVAGSRLEISRIKLENLQNALTIKNLQKEREAEKQKRNFTIAAIIMLAVIIILFLNRQRQKSTHRQMLAIQQKAAAEREVTAAREQLEMFRQNIIEKADLIEKLQLRVQDKEQSTEHQQIIDELTHQTILTESDWDKFKNLFDKIYSGFFMKLKGKAVDITLAEQRMAALTRLHLTPKEMAAMLGISVDSVHKTRQRLRQRLHLSTDVNLEEVIANLS